MAKTRYVCTDCGWATYGSENLVGGHCPICGGEGRSILVKKIGPALHIISVSIGI